MKSLISIIIMFFSMQIIFAQNELETRTINGVTISFYEREIPSGNHPLIYLYIGTLGIKPFKLFITGVNANKVLGYSITGTNKVSFSGTFTEKDTTYIYDIGTEEQLKENTDFNIKGTVYYLKLIEPTSNNKNGKFNLVIYNLDAMGSEGEGKWVSYDKTLNRNIILTGAIEP
jgi:hypothetical protein